MARPASNEVAELSNDVSQQMKVLRDDIANLTATVAEYGKAQGNQLKAVAAQKAAGVAAAGAGTAHAVRVQADKTYADAEAAVRANPGTAIGIAAGLGFLVGFLASRR